MVLFIKTFEKYRTSEFEKAVSGQRVRNSELMFTRIYAETCRLKFLCNILYKVGRYRKCNIKPNVRNISHRRITEEAST